MIHILKKLYISYILHFLYMLYILYIETFNMVSEWMKSMGNCHNAFRNALHPTGRVGIANLDKTLESSISQRCDDVASVVVDVREAYFTGGVLG